MTRLRALAVAIVVAMLLALHPTDPKPTLLYDSGCRDRRGLDWVFEGCWWQN